VTIDGAGQGGRVDEEQESPLDALADDYEVDDDGDLAVALRQSHGAAPLETSGGT
jgi:hypothetical protein